MWLRCTPLLTLLHGLAALRSSRNLARMLTATLSGLHLCSSQSLRPALACLQVRRAALQQQVLTLGSRTGAQSKWLPVYCHQQPCTPPLLPRVHAGYQHTQSVTALLAHGALEVFKVGTKR